MRSLSILENGTYQKFIEPYLGVRELVKLRQISRSTREWMRSSKIEKACLIRCLKKCYGLWHIADEGRKGKWKHNRPSAPSTWLDLEMILALEADELQAQALDTLQFKDSVWRLVIIPDWSEHLLRLKYLCTDWLRGEEDYEMPGVWPAFLQHFQIYECIKGGFKSILELSCEELKEFTSRIASRDFSAWHYPSHAPGAPHSICSLYKTDERTRGLDCLTRWEPLWKWTRRVTLPPESPERERTYTPREAAIPFHLRVVLEDKSLVARLIDVEDTELNPRKFLDTYAPLWLDVEWSFSEAESLSDGGYRPREDCKFPDRSDAITQFITKMVVSHSGVFYTPPESFWNIDEVIGVDEQFDAQTLLDQMESMEDRYDWWDDCCKLLTPHYQYYMKQMVTILQQQSLTRPFLVGSEQEAFCASSNVRIRGAGDSGLYRVALGLLRDDESPYTRLEKLIYLLISERDLVLYCAMGTWRSYLPDESSDWSD